jgi:hypothetical protein
MAAREDEKLGIRKGPAGNRDGNRSVFNKPKTDGRSVYKRTVFGFPTSGRFWLIG